VLTHYAVEQDTTDLANGLVLINMVVDIERIGDYCKNILDLAINQINLSFHQKYQKILPLLKMR